VNADFTVAEIGDDDGGNNHVVVIVGIIVMELAALMGTTLCLMITIMVSM
jgi:hypothetical protein